MRRLMRYWPGPLLALAVGFVSLSAVSLAQSPTAPRGKSPGPGLPPDQPTPAPVVEAKGPVPDLALRPSQITKLPVGQRANDITLPATHGQLRLLPTGSVPQPIQLPLDSTKGYQRTRPWRADTLDGVPSIARGLVPAPPYIPTGWQLATITGSIALGNDDSQQATGATVQYQRTRYFPITIARTHVGSSMVELVNPGRDTPFAVTLTSISGVPVLVDHQAPGAKVQALMRVHVIQNGMYTVIEAPAFDLDELLEIARRLIESER